MMDMDLSHYTSPTLDPDAEQWESLLTANLARPVARVGNLIANDIHALRRSLVMAARDYVAQRRTLAQRHGVHLPALDSSFDIPPHGGDDGPLVLTGHQPNILHPGIVYKFEMTGRFAESQHATAVAILMDVDSGNAGEFLVPRGADASTSSIASPAWTTTGSSLETIADSDSLYFGQRLRSADELEAISERVARELRLCRVAEAADQYTAAMTTYRQLAGCSAVMANSIVRRAHHLSPQLLELPLSSLCRVPHVQQWLAHLALDGHAFHQTYNQTLDAWRQLRKLRNPANPFPNLEHQGDRLELPLWRVDLLSRTRHAVWAECSPGQVELFAGHTLFAKWTRDQPIDGRQTGTEYLLVPRGALITILFRLLCSDLFVHGLGGQTYDHYTDTLIESYFGIKPPAFAVASASRYLFEPQRQQLRQLARLAAHRRQLEHHPETYLRQGWFSEPLERRLEPWIDQKQQLIAALRDKKQSGTTAAEEGRRLEGLRNEIKSSIASELAAPLARLEGLTDAARQAIEWRMYPWFFFAWDQTLVT
jgi:hypothetical protein